MAVQLLNSCGSRGNIHRLFRTSSLHALVLHRHSHRGRASGGRSGHRHVRDRSNRTRFRNPNQVGKVLPLVSAIFNGFFCSGVAAAIYLSETFPSRWRVWGVCTLNNFYYIGALIAAGITLGTSSWQYSTWSWRLPSLLQGIFSIACIMILPFV